MQFTILRLTALAAIAIPLFAEPVLATTTTTVPNRARSAANNTQSATQRETGDVNSEGAGDAKMESYFTIGIGTIMIYAGYQQIEAQQYATGAMMVAMGGKEILSGVKGLKGAKKLRENAAIAYGNEGNLLNGNGISSLNDPNNLGNSVDISAADLQNGKGGVILKRLQKDTGITPQEFANSLSGDPSAESILKSLQGKLKMSDKDIAKALDSGRKLAADPAASKAAEEKFGASKFLGETKSAGEIAYADGASKAGGKGGSSTSDQSLEDFLKSLKTGEEEQKGVESLNANLDNLSEDVKESLAKNGVTDKTLFQMVHSKYAKNSYMMFGQAEESTAGESVAIPEGPTMIKDGRLPSSLPNF